MNPVDALVGLFTFAAIVAVVPVWDHFVSSYSSGLSMEARFLAMFSLPAVLLFFLASWWAPG